MEESGDKPPQPSKRKLFAKMAAAGAAALSALAAISHATDPNRGAKPPETPTATPDERSAYNKSVQENPNVLKPPSTLTPDQLAENERIRKEEEAFKLRVNSTNTPFPLSKPPEASPNPTSTTTTPTRK